MSNKYGPKIVTDGLVLCLDAAYKKSYPGSGTTWYDSSGYDNHVTLINNPTFNGSDISFDGTNDTARTINNLNLSNTNAVSVDYFCKINTYGGNTGIIAVELTSNFNSYSEGFYAGFNDGVSDTKPIVIAVRGSSGYNVSYWPKTLVNDAQWHHWCCIIDKSQSGAETFLYIDGIYREGTFTSYNANNTNNFGSGHKLYFAARNNTSYYANYNLSNFKFYNRALSASEIFQNYKMMKGRYNL